MAFNLRMDCTTGPRNLRSGTAILKTRLLRQTLVQSLIVRAASRESLAPLPDGNLGLPLFGETLDLIFSGDTFGTSRRQRYGNVFKTNILGAPTVMVYGEEAVRAVLSAEDRLVASDWPAVTSVLVGHDSLNLLSGARHSAVKRALAEAFSERQMQRHVPRIAQVVQEYISRWAAGPQPLAGYAACQELSQAVFDAVVLGGDGSPARAARLQELMSRLQAGFQAPSLELPFTDYGRAVQARRELGTLVQQALAAFRRGRSQGVTSASAPASPDCALADIAAAGAVAAAAAAGSEPLDEPPLSPLLADLALVDNVMAAFFGNASTGPSLAKALQFLAACPEVLEGLRREQLEIVASHGTTITAEALEQMSYGAAVARELLRITPAVPAVFRVAIQDFELQGRRIPKGWRVWCHLSDSVLKYNNDKFDPERWRPPSGNNLQQQQQRQDAKSGHEAASETSATMYPPAAANAAVGGGCPVHGPAATTHGSVGKAASAAEYSLPFGTGTRACLGRYLVLAELLVVLAVLARGYDWRALNPGEEWRVVPAPAPKDGLLVELRRWGS